VSDCCLAPNEQLFNRPWKEQVVFRCDDVDGTLYQINIYCSSCNKQQSTHMLVYR